MHGTNCERQTVARTVPAWVRSGILDRIDPAGVKQRARAPSILLKAAAAAAALLSFSGSVNAQTTMDAQAQCTLSAMRDTRSALAIQSIRSACNWLAVNGNSLLNESSRGYYLCLVRQLSGAQADEAASAIISACRTSNPL
ncbi:VF_A0006 family four-cysteine protein [Bradyrhizobium jicamae]|uniref:VF_A0006 family four-cysteine protein n=1 Tax=Bradyrhizobium jicamae TaxID=280332 RepID=UPI002011F29C|nr:VF_A0006 family four-cysteine protein [Bradyrhizobium jicamae]